MQDPLQHDGQAGPLAQRGEMVPAQPGVGVDVEERLHRGARLRGAQVVPEPAGVVAGDRQQRPDRPEGDLDLLLDPGGAGGRDPFAHQLTEPRVRGVLPDPHPLRERQRPEVEVLRAPAQRRGVQGDDQGACVDRLGAPDQAVDELLVGAPVELHPAGRVAHGSGALLHRVAALVGEHVGHPGGRGRARDVQVAVGVDQLAGADRSEQDRHLEAAAEQLDRQVAPGDAVRHPRHDRPPVEGGAVVAHRASLTGTARHVGPSLRRAGPARSALELGEVGRDGGPAAEHAGAVDGPLPLASR